MEVNLSEQIGNLMNNIGTNPINGTAQVPGKTTIFADDMSAKLEKTDEEKEALRKARQEKATLTSNVAQTIRGRSQERASTPKGRLSEYISNNAFIAGYIVAQDARFDFFSKRTNKAEEGVAALFTIGVKMYAPSKPENVIINYPLEAEAAITDPKLTSEIANAAISNSAARIVKIERMDQIKDILSQKAAGYLKEHTAIFDPYYSKKVKIAQPGDVVSNFENVPPVPCLHTYLPLKAVSQQGTGSLVVVKALGRNKIITPKNYIARKRYATLDLKTSYTADEAEQLNKLYLSKFTKTNKQNRCVIEALDDNTSKFFDVKLPDQNNPTSRIMASAFFPTDPSSNWFTNNKVYHWYNKDAQGNPVAVPLNEIKLVKKEIANPETGSIKAIALPLKDITASEGSYKFDRNGAHKAVCLAAGEMLTHEMIYKAPRSKAKSSAPKLVAALAGNDVVGLTDDEIRSLLSEHMGIAK